MKLTMAAEMPKLIAVRNDKPQRAYRDIKEYTDLPELLMQQIQHFL